MNEERCWQAVATRDATMDGQFFYAVQSTGIYCRPGCPSRRPRREHVQFFRQAEAAEQAGFRACQRCHPREQGISAEHRELVARACATLESVPVPTLAELGAQLGMSPFHLQRTFKRIMGMTPRQYAAAHRLAVLKGQLKQGEHVTRAMYEAGYGSSSRLYEQASARLGMTPATYGRGGAGAQISYTLAATPFGQVLVAATERGVCFVSLGDDAAALEASLTQEFPAASITRADEALNPWVTAIVQHLSGDPATLDLPLDVRATAFQQRVWQALCAIPYGSTRTYGEIAAALGQPTAARAVARACATNPIALVVPCHRVVGEGGELRGYRWGVARKQALLAHEHMVMPALNVTE